MKRALKIFAVLFAGLLLLVVALAVLARILITPERIRAVVIPRVEAALHRDVSLAEVDISIFTGITLDRLTVLEADGSEPFIAAESVVLRYRLWPLLFKRIVIDEIRLVAPQIRVERRADGQFNFSDLLPGEAPAPATAAEEGRREPIDLLVSQVEISDGRLLFVDHLTGGGTPFRQEVTGLNFAAREISLGGSFPYSFAARINQGVVEGKGTVDPQALAGRLALTIADLDLAAFAPYYRDKLPAQVRTLPLNLQMEAEGSREAVQARGEVTLASVDLLLPREGKSPLPIRNATLRLDYAVTAELAAAALEIERANLAVNRIPVQVAGRIVDYATAPKVNLRVVLPELALEEAMKQLPAELTAPAAELQPAGKISGQFHLAGPASAPKKLLQTGELRLGAVSALVGGERPAVTGVLKLAGDALAAENLQVQMGENRAAVDLRADNLLGDVVRVRSSVRSERFALDPLLKGSASPAAAKAPPAAEKDPFPLALPVVAEGSVAIGETLYKGLSIRDFYLRYRLQKNVLTVERLNGKAAGGTFAVTGSADLGQQRPAFTSRLAVQGIQAEPLLQAFYPPLAGTVFGTVTFKTELAGQGSDAAAVKKSLSADGALQLADGRITGARLLQGLADFLALPELRELRFNEGEGSFTIRQGKLSLNSDINSKSVRLHPQGTVALDDYAVDLALNLQLAPELVSRLGSRRVSSFLADTEGWAQVPVKVGGTLTAPRFTLDTAAAGEKLRQRAGEELRRKLQKELDRRLPPGNGKPGEEPARSGAEELLRGLFGR